MSTPAIQSTKAYFNSPVITILSIVYYRIVIVLFNFTLLLNELQQSFANVLSLITISIG